MSAINIPTDILEAILYEVSCLENSTEMLGNCSIASKCLLVPARRFLFQTIDLCIDFRVQSIRFEMLITKQPSIGSYVRTLIIQERVRAGDFRLLSHGSRMARILKALSALQVLQLRSFEPGKIQWTTLSESLKKAFVEQFRSGHLYTLTLSNMEGLPLSVLMGSAGLKKITLENVKVLNEEEDYADMKDAPKEYVTQPVSLDFSRSFQAARGFLRAAKDDAVPFRLDHLSFMRWAPASKNEFSAIRPVVASYGKYQFTEFEYNLIKCKQPVHMPEVGVKLDELPYVRVLSFRIGPTFFRDPSHLNNLCAYISTAPPSNTITELNVIVEDVPFTSKITKQQVVEGEWAYFDNLLVNTLCFPCMKVFSIAVNLKPIPGRRRISAKGAEEEQEMFLSDMIRRKLRMIEATGNIEVKVAVNV